MTTPAPSPSPPPAQGTEAWRSVSSIRIGLAVGAPRVRIAGSRAYSLHVVGGDRVLRGETGEIVVVSRDASGALTVTPNNATDPVWTGGADDTLELVPELGGYSGWNGNWYRGPFRIFASQPQGVTLVNQVGLEDYLRSVLPNEIGTPPETDFEAVKAQAVAARSYTVAYLGRRAPFGFDLYASVEDQVYAGVTRENAQSNRAVEATLGEVLVSDGQPIKALYSSACGGRTANVEDVWPWDYTPYLRSVRDDAGPGTTPYCSISSNFRWREEWDPDSFVAMVRQYGVTDNPAAASVGGDLLDVRVDKRSRSGRVQDLGITTTTGDLFFHGDRTRWVLRRPGSNAILRSSLFKIGIERGENGKSRRVVATGGGNGHGIGMCQWGAMGMARAGIGYRDILSHYYKATKLVRI